MVPTNSRMKVFNTHDVDNLDSKSQGNFLQSEFHGDTLSVTNHLSHDNLEVKRPPIKVCSSNKSPPWLPDFFRDSGLS